MAKSYALLPDAMTMYTQTEALKEVKDMSKNLVNGDYEREYRGDSNRRRKCGVWMWVVLGVVVAWLVGLTVLREVQLSRLRRELDQLSANMIAVTANVKSLNQKISDSKIFNEFKNFDDTIYADEDQDVSISEDKSNAKGDGSLEKLHSLTVLENDDDLSDDEDIEDMYDDEEQESGDWYQDYDRRREKTGTSNMVRLKPEDFTGSVVNLGEKYSALNSQIREIKRMLNENPENPNIVFPPPASTSTQAPQQRERRSLIPDLPVEVDQLSHPTDSIKYEERRKTKKYMPSTESSTKMSFHTVSRTTRNSDDEGRKPFVAAHFHGNTTHLNPEIHEHYKGNGLVRVNHDQPHDVWYPAPWTMGTPHPRPTLIRNGHVRIHQTGVYFVYVQIYYLDSHDIISWVLHRTNPMTDGRDRLLQCAQSAHSSNPEDKPNSCFSASALLLRAGDRLAVRNTGGDRHSLMEPEKSFIGLVKLADAEDPDDL